MLRPHTFIIMKSLPIILLLLLSPSLSVSAVEPVLLTTEEKAWVSDNPVIQVGNEEDWAPFDFAEDGEAKGYSIDIVRLLAGKTGLQVSFVNGYSWDELLMMLQKKEIDLLPAIMETEARSVYLDFSDSYLSNPTVMVVPKDTADIQSINDMAGRRVAYVKGYYYEDRINKDYPDVLKVPVPGFLEGLESVLDGHADAFIGNRVVVMHTIRQHVISGLRISGRSGIDDPNEIKLRMGVPKGNLHLQSILNKALAAITPGERREIADRWIGMDASTKKQRARNQRDLKFQFAFDIGGEPGFSIIQDKDGFLWFSSFFNGLVRFDGTSVKRFREGPHSISSDFVTQIFEDSRGDIWVGTNSGLNRYRKTDNSFTLFRKDPGSANSLVGDTFNLSSRTIIEDRAGFLWFGTQSGLSRFDPGTEQFTAYQHDPEDPDSLSENDIFSLFEDSTGTIWVSTKSKGVNRLDPSTGKFERFEHDDEDPASIPDNNIQAIVEDTEGFLWFASRESGLIRYDRVSGAFKHYTHNPEDLNSLPPMSIWDLTLLSNGTLAVSQSTSSVGLILFDPKTGLYDQFNRAAGGPFSLTTDIIQDVFEDKDHTLWVVHNNGKVDKADPQAHRFDLYHHNPLDPASLASNAAIPIYEDRQGRIWIGHFGEGLDRFIPESKSFVHHRPVSGDSTTLPHGYPAGFFEDEQGRFLVSTAKGMVYFDPDKGVVTERLTDDTWFYSIIQDDEDPDILWAVGWEQSFNRYNRKTGERKVFRHDPDDPDSFSAVTSIRFIRDSVDPKIFWIATWGGGLERFDQRTETFLHHRHDTHDKASISSDTVFDVFEDSHGKFWVCTDRGLNLFDKTTGTFKRFTKDDGFEAKIVHNIMEDAQGDLWMATDIGLMQFNPVTERVVNLFTRDDGLHSHDFFASARGQTRSGQLWFGGFNGLNAFYPSSLKKNTVAPQIYLTAIKQDGKELHLPSAFEKIESLDLGWDANDFEFEYVALNFTNSSKNRYQYYLEGYDDNWYSAEDHQFGRYSSLPGGDYVLRIKGTNNDGVWSLPTQEVALAIHVSSPPWRTWWAYILYLFLGAGLIHGFLRWRLHVSMRHRQDLERQVKERTQELEEASDLIVKRTDALRESQERFELAMEVSNLGLWDWQLKKNELIINDGWAKMIGHGKDEISHDFSEWTDRLHPDSADKVLAAFNEHVSGKTSLFETEFQLRAKDGTYRWILSIGKAIEWDEQRNPSRVIGVQMDLTERKQAETEAIRLKEELALIMDAAGEGISGLDLEGKTTFINPAGAAMLGYTPKELSGKLQHTLIHHTKADGEHYPREECHIYATFHDGKTHQEEGEVFWRKDGSSFPVEYSSQPIMKDGKIMGAVVTFKDITERKIVEEKLLQAQQEAESATKQKSDFLANMSHEIRTPMNAIIGMSYLALKTELTPKQRDYLTKVQSSSNALLGIINDILDFSKIEAGKLDMESTGFQLEDVFTNLATLIGIKAESKGLELLFNIDGKVPTSLTGDPLRLGQILINLSNNAVKFTETGEIVVSVSVVEKDESGTTLKFSVQDSGIGLTEEQRGKLFQAFSQADTSTTRKYGGTGLGLTISKKLCEMMGGEIWVESVPGEGSTFFFTAVFEIHAEKKAPLLPQPDLRGRLVLVVDDNQTSREIMRDMLESMSFVVEQVASGEEAVSAVVQADREGSPFDLIYMDWQMPGKDGIAASKEIKEQDLSLQPKIVMVTAYGREEIMQQAEAIKLDGFLVKPLSRSLLFDATMQAFGREGTMVRDARTDKGPDIDSLKDIRGARILLAEDNEINQQVAREILEQASLVVEIANNGQEAFEMAKQNPYDVILMDIQMPVMGGFDATEKVRGSESEFRNIPIVAMTAHAMSGDREKSLEHGMNDHVTKPINPDELFGALLKWVKPGARELPRYLEERLAEDAETAPGQPLPEFSDIDVKSGLSRVGGNEKLYKSLLVKFYREYPDSAGQIREALAREDMELGARLAHTVKGVAGNVGAMDLQAAGAEVEAAIANGTLDNIDALLKTFEKNIRSIMDGLKDFVEAEEAGGETKDELAPGDPARLKELLARLEPFVQKKKPRPCREVMAEIDKSSWPEFAVEIGELRRLIGKYKFKDAGEVLASIVGKI